MIPLKKLKTVLIRCSTFGSRTKLELGGLVPDLKPRHFSPCLENHLLYSRPICSENQMDSTVSYLKNSCGLSPEGAISASKRLNLMSPERADSILALLRSHGFSQTHIAKIVRGYPKILICHPEKILLPKLEYYSSIGLPNQALKQALASHPKCLSTSLEKKIIPNHNYLRSLLSHQQVLVAFKRNPRLLSEDHSKNVVPNVALLREQGMPQSCITHLFSNCSRILTQKHEMFGDVVREVKKMGFNMENSTFFWACFALCRKNTFNRSRRAYLRWGWSEDDILIAFRKRPQCMILSEKNIMQKLEFLVNKVGWPSETIAKSPNILCYSLNMRIIPRCSVIKVLLMKDLVDRNFSLYYVMQHVEKSFIDEYVTKHLDRVPQLLDLYQGKLAIQDVS